MKRSDIPGMIKYGSFKEAFKGVMKDTEKKHEQAVKSFKDSMKKDVKR